MPRTTRLHTSPSALRIPATESDNLVALQQQVRGCDGILEKMESLLGGFQSDLGKISTEVRVRRGDVASDRWLPSTLPPPGRAAERVGPRLRLTRCCTAPSDASPQIKALQEQSFTMSIKLRNRKAAESALGQFVEDITLPPKLITGISESEARRRRSALPLRSRPRRLQVAPLR